jgi:RHS repeat-associated protein
VDVATGIFFSAWHDAEIAGETPLVFRRYFSTALASESLAQLGPGWTHNFAISLAETPEGYSLRDQNGAVVKFDRRQGSAASLVNEASTMELRAEADALCVYHWHDWRTAVEKLWFRRSPTGSLRLEKIAPPSGFGLVLRYDEAGRLADISQVIEGRRISCVYNERGSISQLLLGSRFSNERTIAEYFYDSQGRLVEVRDAADASIHYGYDRRGRMTREETRGGAVFSMQYDLQGRCVDTRGKADYHACRLKFLEAGRMTVVTDSLGKVTVYELNDYGQVLVERRSGGAVLSTQYDEFGRIAQETGPTGGSTRYSYDDRGNTASIVYPSGSTLEVEYDRDHQPTLLRKGRVTWCLAYDKGQLISVTDPRGRERRYGYDALGFLSSIMDPGGNTIRITPDDAWVRVRKTDDLGLLREERYNDLMHITQITEPDGTVYLFEYDATGKLVRATAPGMSPRRYVYDAGGHLASATDAGGYTVRLRHNVYGLLEEIIAPSGRKFRCIWDTEDHLKTWINPAGERAEFEYDSAGNMTKTRHFDGRVETAEFDVAGRLARRVLADGVALDFEYDNSNNVVRIHSGGADLIVNDYDVEGRLLRTRTRETDVSFEYGLDSRVLAEIQNGRRIEYTYDVSGRLIARGFSDSPLPPLQFEWDQRLRVVSLRRGGAQVETFSYDVKDQCVERRFADCIERLTYAPSGRLAAQMVTRQDGMVASRSWAYDSRGNVIQVDDWRFGESRYEFDGDHRLVRSWSNGAAAQYGYDSGGNLVSCDGPSSSRSFEYLAGNRLARVGARSYERDENANVTRIVDGDAVTSLVWNALGQLARIHHADGSESKYAYDGLGRRLRHDRNGVKTEFIWAGEQLLGETSAGRTIEYLFGGFNPTAIWRGTRVSHFVNSHLGVPLEEVTDWGAVAWAQDLDDWGNSGRKVVDGEGRAVPLRFPGQYADGESGFHYNRFRYYDPKACQYLSADPQGLAAGANEYIYCPNPINWIDPFGLSCGIPPGQHSVYVLEKGPPPTPPTVIYVGITVQAPHDRLSQHMGDPPAGVTPDSMRIIATGPPAVPDRVAARLIEASILNNAIQPPNPGSLNNAERPVNTGSYYHSNIPSAAPPGTTYLPPSATNALLNPANGTRIT